MKGATARRLAILVTALAACGREGRGGATAAWVVLDAAGLDGQDIQSLAELSVDPPAARVQAVRSGSRVVVEVDAARARGGLRIEVPGACPVHIDALDVTAGATVRRRLAPFVDLRLPAHALDLGYDAPFEIEASTACSEPVAGAFRWRQLSGHPLGAVHAVGGKLEARTPAWPGGPAPEWGIVPVSARTSEEATLEVAWTFASGTRAPVRRAVTVAAASPSHGLPSVPVDGGVVLAGSGWTFRSRPPGSKESIATSDGRTHFVPDVPGTWVLEDAAHHVVSIQAGRYDQMPHDCGRSACHAPVASAAIASPMSDALRNLPAAARPCALACHTTGGTSAHDGGFSDVARRIGIVVGERDWDDLPSSLLAAAGVTCVGCHGPAAIPPPEARWAVLRADVCAKCHDAPPTYGHVTAWRASRMARADADPMARSSPACARCHTTSGFLASQSGTGDSRAAPPEAGPVGIACAACHAPHEEHGGQPAPHLVRRIRTPASLASADLPDGSSICLACHAPARAGSTHSPAASAASLWAGRGGIDPATGEPLRGRAIHAGVAGGCIGCHRAGPPDLERGATHAFGPDRTVCDGCHSGLRLEADASDQRIHDEVTALLERISRERGVATGPAARPPHANATDLSDDPRGRATYDILLVAEDPAAASHNGPYARMLLAAARKELDAELEGGGR